MEAWNRVKNSALEKIGSDSRNWASIIMLITLIIGIIGVVFNFRARIERLETEQSEIQFALKEKVDENVLTIHLNNINDKLDKMNESLLRLIHREK